MVLLFESGVRTRGLNPDHSMCFVLCTSGPEADAGRSQSAHCLRSPSPKHMVKTLVNCP